jgi:dolichyl-phosphate-mannose--protein O-mannosyl transferase
MSKTPWHANALGNATEPLLYMFAALLLGCLLSGKWWLMAYLFGAVLLFCVALLYAIYLEYNAQDYLERMRKSHPKKA